MSKFYTNVSIYRDEVLVRGYENGERVQYSVPFKPYLFVTSKGKNTRYKTLKGLPVDRVDFGSISEARDFMRRYDDIDNFNVYGLTQFQYLFIADEFPGEIKYDAKQISVVSLDIETASDDGFPDIATANKEVIAITVSKNGRKVVLGYHDYTPKKESITYIKCADEKVLLSRFIEIMRSKQFLPDIITGWNVEFFDMPYLCNRINRVLGDQACKKLSPWNYVGRRKIELMGREQEVMDIVGVTVLDYMQLYKKFSFSNEESYKLDHIAQVVLGDKKVDYSEEYSSLDDLYKRNFELFIDYNIQDVELVDRMEDKLKFIEQVYALAYDGKVNYLDTFTSVRMWDIIIHNYLLEQDIVVPQTRPSTKGYQIEGAYVKDPQVGMHKWVVSFDLNSLYPHLIMQYNISPETFAGQIEKFANVLTSIGRGQDGKEKFRNDPTDSIRMFIDDRALDDPAIRSQLSRNNVTITPTGCMFDKDYQGFLPKLMESMYNGRTYWKNRMLEAKKKYEENPSYELEKEIAQCHNMQLAKKIQLNSAYGALGNAFFRWFDPRFAESITKSGQLSIRWMEKKINEYLNKKLKTEGVDYVIACDTDSMYITLDKLVTQVLGESSDTAKTVKFLDKLCNEVFEPYIDKSYSELAEYVNAYDQKMKMKREAIADKGIWTAKKRYILNVWNLEGVAYHEPKLKVMGIEAVRSSTPAACRENIKKALKVIMQGSEDALIQFVEDFKMEFKKLPFEQVAFPRGCNGLSEYSNHLTVFNKGTPIHVKGALIFNDMIKRHKLDKKYKPIYEGEKVKFAYLRTPNPTRERVISISETLPKEFGLEKFIDYETQFEKAFLEPIRTIIDTLGWHTEKQATLEGFFS